MIYNHEAGRWEPENEEEAEEYAAYMQETMGGHLLSDDDLRKIEERWNKATPGEWRVERTCCEENMFFTVENDGISPFDLTDEDREAIAHARTDIPSLVAVLREERAAHHQTAARASKLDAERTDLEYRLDAEITNLMRAGLERDRVAAENAQLRAEVERLRWELIAERASYDSLEENRDIVEAENATLRAENERLRENI